MANPLYQQLNSGRNNNLLSQIMEFKKSIKGNPQDIVQSMLNSGRISQDQVNRYAQQANEIYRQIGSLMK